MSSSVIYSCLQEDTTPPQSRLNKESWVARVRDFWAGHRPAESDILDLLNLCPAADVTEIAQATQRDVGVKELFTLAQGVTQYRD